MYDDKVDNHSKVYVPLRHFPRFYNFTQEHF